MVNTKYDDEEDVLAVVWNFSLVEVISNEGDKYRFYKKTKNKIFHCNAEALIQSSASGLYIRPTWGT